MTEDKKLREIIQPKNPKFKIITRGPRKGQMVRTTRHERTERIRQNMAALETEREAQKRNDVNTDASSSRPFSGEVLLAFVVIYVMCGLSYGAAYGIGLGLRALGIGSLFFPLIFVDFVIWRNLSKPKRHSKYLPFIWWL